MILKQNDTPKHLQELTGSPSPTAVSDVAKGGKPQTLNEFDDAYHDMSGAVKSGQMSEMPAHKSMCDDINEAYAMLFESLSMIARSKGTVDKSE